MKPRRATPTEAPLTAEMRAIAASSEADQALVVDLSCKAAAGDDIAALGMALMDRIHGTRGAGRDVCLVEHDTVRRLLKAAGYGLDAVHVNRGSRAAPPTETTKSTKETCP